MSVILEPLVFRDFLPAQKILKQGEELIVCHFGAASFPRFSTGSEMLQARREADSVCILEPLVFQESLPAQKLLEQGEVLCVCPF